MISGAFIGSGVMLIFSGGIVFLVDIYLEGSASALAANTMIRSLAACGLPLAAPSLYQNLGVQWATSVLGFIALALMPVPMLFFIYGARIRKLSKFVPNMPPGMGPGGPPVAGPPAQAVRSFGNKACCTDDTLTATPSTLPALEKV